MSRPSVYCPTGCGSKSFRASRRAALVEDFNIDDENGDIIDREALAEGGGTLHLACTQCGHHWRSRRDLDLALFVEGR